MITVTAPLWVGLVVGMAFGAAASLWGIGNPETVIRTGRLVDRLVIGCFLFVTAVGSVLLYGLHALGVAMHFSPKPTYVFGVLLGGALFGVGAAISGYFPGTILIALGEGRRDALMAIPGGLLGAAAWTATYQTPVGRWLVDTADFGDVVLGGNIAHVPPTRMLAIALAYAALALALLYHLPRYRGGSHCCFRDLNGGSTFDACDRQAAADTAAYLWEGAERSPSGRRANWFEKLSREQVTDPRFFARTISVVAFSIAVITVSAIVLRQQFGQSTTYSWVVGKLFMPHYAYSQQVFDTIGWEPLSDVGVLIGAFLSAYFISRRYTRFRPVIPPSWRNRYGPSRAKRAVAVFTGSFLVLYGARMAGGCTSGHTLSGGVQLSVSAWLFTVALLGTMFLTAKLVYGNASWMTTRPDRPALATR